jgi:hypothetical protein
MFFISVDSKAFNIPVSHLESTLMGASASVDSKGVTATFRGNVAGCGS